MPQHEAHYHRRVRGRPPRAGDLHSARREHDDRGECQHTSCSEPKPDWWRPLDGGIRVDRRYLGTDRSQQEWLDLPPRGARGDVIPSRVGDRGFGLRPDRRAARAIFVRAGRPFGRSGAPTSRLAAPTKVRTDSAKVGRRASQEEARPGTLGRASYCRGESNGRRVSRCPCYSALTQTTYRSLLAAAPFVVGPKMNTHPLKVGKSGGTTGWSP